MNDEHSADDTQGMRGALADVQRMTANVRRVRVEQFADDGNGVRVAFGGNVFVSFFYGPPTAQRLGWLFENESRWIADVPRFSAISIIDPRTGREMSAEARARAKEITQALNGRMVASCTVVEATGFFAAVVRSVIAGVQIFSDRRTAWNVLTNTEDALSFIQGAHAKESAPFDLDAARAAVLRARG